MIYYRLLSEHRLLLLYFCGVTPVKDIKDLREKIWAMTDWSQPYDALLDVSHLEHWYTNEELEEFSYDEHEEFYSGCKVAIVASSDLAFGMNRMYETAVHHNRSFEQAVFRDVSSALKWLGREGLDVEKHFAEMRSGKDSINTSP